MVLNRLIVMYKLMFLAMNRIESGVITNGIEEENVLEVLSGVDHRKKRTHIKIPD